MVWIALTGAIVLLGFFLVNVVKSYERESARVALDKVDRLSETVEALEIRIRNLEAIATDGPENTDDSGTRQTIEVVSDHADASMQTGSINRTSTRL